MTRTEPARGMRDLLAADVRRREYVVDVVRSVYERYGYEPLETPAVENLGTLLGKYGDEGNQLIFKILKRGAHEATGQADLALRYDLTVPLARVMAHHHSKLPRLFKRYQIQPVWRADRPSRGRFREFYQCDVDAVGTTSPVVEAELCAAVSDVLEALRFDDFVIQINHRDVLTALLVAAGVPEPQRGEAVVALDKLDKVGIDGVAKELVGRQVPQAAVNALIDMLGGAESHDLEALEARVGNRPESMAGFDNLRTIFGLVESTGSRGRVKFHASLARGLSYYTGAIMEIVVPELSGSIGAGGRYDNLVGMFAKQPIPACGFSLGLERIVLVMQERHMFPEDVHSSPADVLVTLFDEATTPTALRLATRLRSAGLRVLVYPDAGKLGHQFKHASERKIPFVAVLGEDEVSAGTVTVKDLAKATQSTYAEDMAAAAILEAVRTRG